MKILALTVARALARSGIDQAEGVTMEEFRGSASASREP